MAKVFLQNKSCHRSQWSPGVQVSWATATPWTTPPSWCQSFASAPNRARPWRPTSSAGGWTSGRLVTLITATIKLSGSFRFSRLSYFFGTSEQKENNSALLQPFPFRKRPLNFTLPFCFLLLCPCLSPTGLDGVGGPGGWD